MLIKVSNKLVVLLIFALAFAKIDVKKPAQSLAVYVYSPSAEINSEQCENIAEDLLDEFMNIETYLYFENSNFSEKVKREIELCDSYFSFSSKYTNVNKDNCIQGLAATSSLSDKLVIVELDKGYIRSRLIESKTGLITTFSAIETEWLSNSTYRNPKEHIASNLEVQKIAKQLHSDSDNILANREKYFTLNFLKSKVENEKSNRYTQQRQDDEVNKLIIGLGLSYNRILKGTFNLQITYAQFLKFGYMRNHTSMLKNSENLNYYEGEILSKQYKIGFTSQDNKKLDSSINMLLGYRKELFKSNFGGEDIKENKSYFGVGYDISYKFLIWEMGVLKYKDDFELFLQIGCILNIRL